MAPDGTRVTERSVSFSDRSLASDEGAEQHTTETDAVSAGNKAGPANRGRKPKVQTGAERRPPKVRQACEACALGKRSCKMSADGEACARCLEKGIECRRIYAEKRGPKGPWRRREAGLENLKASDRKRVVRLVPTKQEEDDTPSPSRPDPLDFQLLQPVAEAPEDPLPSIEAINLCLQLFPLWAEIRCPVLHPSIVLEADTPSSLLIYSVLLVSPHAIWVDIPGAATTAERLQWEKSLFRRARTEVLALLDRGHASATPEDIASLYLLHLFIFSQGLYELSAKVLGLVESCLEATGIVLSRETMLPGPAAPLWEQVVAREYGPQGPPLYPTPEEISHMRSLWIDTWIRQRLSRQMLIIRWRNRDLARTPEATPPFDFISLQRPMLPSPATWEASTTPSFDPRGAPIPPLMIDALGFLALRADDPARTQPLLLLRTHLAYSPTLLYFLHFILRSRVDRFIAACVRAGLASPASLPVSAVEHLAVGLSPVIQELLMERRDLEQTMIQVIGALPTEITTAAALGSAAGMLEGQRNAFSSTAEFDAVTVNLIPEYLSILLLRHELYSVVGTILTASGLKDPTLVPKLPIVAAQIAEEYKEGGQLAGGLEAVVAATRVLREWPALNPVFPFLALYTTLPMRLFAVHLSFWGVFTQSNTVELQAFANAVYEDIQICLDVLDRLGRRNLATRAFGATLRALVVGLPLDRNLVEGGLMQKDLSAHAEGGATEEVAPLKTVLATYRAFGRPFQESVTSPTA